MKAQTANRLRTKKILPKHKANYLKEKKGGKKEKEKNNTAHRMKNGKPKMQMKTFG